MKKIKSIQSWVNGQSIEATKFQLNANYVNLQISASFYYALFSEDNIKLNEGNLIMDGKDYQDWQNDQYAWDWAATKLNLELIPEVIEEKEVISQPKTI
jgi:hypothetical protein